MIETRALDLVCVSFLADAEVLRVESYPRANGGAVVERVDVTVVVDDTGTRTWVAATGAPLLLNLGGDPPDDSIIAAAHNRRITAVQTSLEETDAGNAEDVAAYLFEQLRPAAAVVTMGRLGALARTCTGIYRAAAPPVVVTHTHGAGAAFSAGYAHALLAGADIENALRAACELGAAHCANPAVATAHPLTAPCLVA